MRSIPNMTWLRVFESAARLESFSLAAEELHLTPSAISHQIKKLEEHMGKLFFERQNRKVFLNQEGLSFYRKLLPILDELGQLCTKTQGHSSSTNLVVYCSPSFAVKWLGPRLNGFMRENSDSSIELRTDAEMPDLRNSTDIDIAISYGHAPSMRAGIAVEAMMPEPIVPLCSPQLFATCDIGELWYKQLPLIVSTLSPVTWGDWFSEQGLTMVKGKFLSFDRGAMAIAAAVDSLGVALETVRFAEKELEQGALVELPSISFFGIKREMHFLHYRNDLETARRVEKFRSWILKEAKQTALTTDFVRDIPKM